LGRRSPSQEHHSSGPLRSNSIYDLLREFLPAAIGMRVGFVSTHGETGVEQEDAAVGPGSEEAAVLGGWDEGGVVFGKRFVDVFQGGRGGSWGLDGEREAVCLVVVMVGVLADDYGFHGVQRRMSRPLSNNVNN